MADQVLLPHYNGHPRIYVLPGWKHNARCEKLLFLQVFLTDGRYTVFPREANVVLRVLCARHNVFQPEGYIFLGFHPLTYHKPLHFDGFCFILPLQILLISWLLSWPCPGGPEGPGIPKWQPSFDHNVTTFKISKKISQTFLLCQQLANTGCPVTMVRSLTEILFTVIFGNNRTVHQPKPSDPRIIQDF